MIISDANRYVFIEVPQTASTAIAQELLRHYQGRRILRRHTDYMGFCRSASADQKRYDVLATIRNPLDIVVSKFIKARDKQGEVYGERPLAGAPWGYRFRQEAREMAFITRRGADFEAFVRRFFNRVFNSRACLLPSHAHVLRYERLDEDFASWLQSAGIPCAGPIPPTNETEGRGDDFASWYPESLRAHAARVFGPYMQAWGYELPPNWPAIDAGLGSRAMFRADTALRRLYFRHFHYGNVMPRARRPVG